VVPPKKKKLKQERAQEQPKLQRQLRRANNKGVAMWLITGLGNPGAKYELTRHNLGFLAIDALLDGLLVSENKKSFSGLCARFSIDNIPCISLKPETFMNRSGISVQQAMSFYKIPLDNLIVIHDEIDIPLGDIRIKKGGSDGGHNGLKDITRILGPNYIRVRLGIGRPHIKGTEADYVLNRFSDDEFKKVSEVLPKAVIAIKALVSFGLEAALKYQCRAQKTA
jgi:PTH1 family peptidyl-tRNA hydrolase